MAFRRLEAFLASLILLSMSIQGVKSTDDEGSQRKADFFFAVDASVKISTTDFRKQLDFVNNVIVDLSIDQKSERCALVTYGKEVHTEFTIFRKLKSQTEITSAVSRSKQCEGVGGTDAALRRFLTMCQEHDKPGVPMTGIVFTHHKSINIEATIETAEVVRKKGIILIVVGIGNEVDDQELKAIASREEFVFRVDSYDGLEVIRTVLTKTARGENEGERITQAPASTIPPSTQATKEKADVVIIVDASASLSRVDFLTELHVVDTFIQRHSIVQTSIRFGLVKYGSTAHTEFGFNTHHSLQEVREVVSKMVQVEGSGGVHLALEQILNLFDKDDRPNVAKTVFLFVDEKFSNWKATEEQADVVRKRGIVLYVVAIGCDVDDRELRAIAGRQEFVKKVKDCGRVTEVRSTSTERETVTPRVEPSTTTTIPKKTVEDCVKHPADVVFVLDESGSIEEKNFTKQLNFVSEVVSLLDVTKDGTHVGLLTFGSIPKPHFDLGSHTSVADVQSAVKSIFQEKGSTDTGMALRHVRENAFVRKEDRAGVRKIVVVITDGKSDNPEETKEEAKLLKETGVTVFAIGVGSAVNNDELVSIASDPSDQHVFTVHDYQALESIKRRLAESACSKAASEETPSSKLSTPFSPLPTDKLIDYVEVPTVPKQVSVEVSTIFATIPTRVPQVSIGCKSRRPADIVFSLPSGLEEQDASHSLRFVATVAEGLGMEHGPIRIGLADRPCHNAVTGFNLGQGTTSKQVSDYIQRLLPSGRIEHVATSLGLLREHGFGADQGSRDTSFKIAVAVLDRASTQINSKTLAQAKLFKSAGIRLIVIVIGKVISEHDEFGDLIGCSICVLRVETYAEIDTLTEKLTTTINGSLCAAATNDNNNDDHNNNK